MSPEQKAAFIIAQAACASAEIAGMQAANLERDAGGYTIAYDEAAFAAVPDRFGIGRNAVISFFQE